MKTENLSTLQLNLLSNEQLKNALNNGKIDPNAFYLTPEENLFIRYAYDAEPTELFDTWAEGMSYIGFAYAEKAPTSYTDYSWSLFIGSDGKDGQPGQSVHIRYSELDLSLLILGVLVKITLDLLSELWLQLLKKTIRGVYSYPTFVTQKQSC